MRLAHFGWMGILVACGQPADSDDAEQVVGPTYYEDVQPILNQNCVSCHFTGGIAPFPLETFEQASVVAANIKVSTASRTMPPWKADKSGECQPWADARWLTDDQIATLGEWVDNGSPAGNPEDAPEDTAEELPGLNTIDATADMGISYTPNDTEEDDYRCFLVDLGATGNQYLTGFEVHPGEARVVHHVVLFDIMDDDALAQAQAMDDAEEGEGYTCFGGSGVNGNLVLAWAPGSPPTQFPAGTGLPLNASRPAILQMHYNTTGGTFPDRTTIDLQLADEVETPSAFGFLVDTELHLTAGQTDVSTASEWSMADLSEWWGAPEDAHFNLYGAFPHQHKLGKSIKVERIRDGEATCLIDVPAWDFHWQQMYFYDHAPIDIAPTDDIRVSCSYDTSTATEDVYWGEGTNDEMCVAGMYLAAAP